MGDNIKVVVKVRPLIKREIDDNLTANWRVSEKTIYQIDQNGKDVPNQQYTFDQVYDENTDIQNIYDEIAKPIVEDATRGINGTIFAYGQTSSGKTYTMMGDSTKLGIIPLAVYNIFDMIESMSDRDFLLRVSYVEVYNEKIKDLLSDGKTNLTISETAHGVKIDAEERNPSSPEEILAIMKQGEVNRQYGATNMNEQSSRSHTIFQISIESKAHNDENGCVNVSQLNLVDLAGSERSGQTGATGQRFKEGTHINKSLLSLGLVIKQLSEGGGPNKFVNYRDSKLTRLLQNSLGGNAKTCIVCAVTPASTEETVSTLQFATRAKTIKNAPKVNAVATDISKLQELTSKLAQLQYELESKQHLEMENKRLSKSITELKNKILNNLDSQKNPKKPTNRRMTWCAPRRATLTTIPEVLSPHRRFNRKNIDLEILVEDEANEQQADCSTPPQTRKKVLFPDKIIEIEDSDEDDSKGNECSPHHKCYSTAVPPCILKQHSKKFEKEYRDLLEMTNLEKMYSPSQLELTQELSLVRERLYCLENEKDKLENDKNIEINKLTSTLSQHEEEIVKLTSLKECAVKEKDSFMTKLAELEISFDNFRKKAQQREEELLSLFQENAANKVFDANVTQALEKRQSIEDFLNVSKDITLVHNETDICFMQMEEKSSSDIEKLEMEIKKRDQVITEMEQKVLCASQKLEIIQKECFAKMEELEMRNKEHEEILKDNECLTAGIEKHLQTIDELNFKLSSKEKDIQSYEELLYSLKGQTKPLKDTTSSLLNTIQNDVIDEECNKSKQFEICVASENEQGHLTDERKLKTIRNLEKEIKLLKETCAKQSEDLKSNEMYMSQLNEINEQKVLLETNYKNLKVEYEQLNVQFEYMKSKHEFELQTIEASLNRSKAELMSKQSEFEIFAKEQQENTEILQKELMEKRIELESLQKKLAQSNEIVQKEFMEKQIELESLQKELAQNNEIVQKELMEKQIELQKKLAQNTPDQDVKFNEMYQSQLNEINEHKVLLETNYNNLKVEYEQLKVQFEYTKSKHEFELQSIVASLNRSKAELISKQSEFDKFAKEQQMNTEILQKELMEKQIELESLQKKLVQNTSDIEDDSLNSCQISKQELQEELFKVNENLINISNINEIYKEGILSLLKNAEFEQYLNTQGTKDDPMSILIAVSYYLKEQNSNIRLQNLITHNNSLKSQLKECEEKTAALQKSFEEHDEKIAEEKDILQKECETLKKDIDRKYQENSFLESFILWLKEMFMLSKDLNIKEMRKHLIDVKARFDHKQEVIQEIKKEFRKLLEKDQILKYIENNKLNMDDDFVDDECWLRKQKEYFNIISSFTNNICKENTILNKEKEHLDLQCESISLKLKDLEKELDKCSEFEKAYSAIRAELAATKINLEKALKSNDELQTKVTELNHSLQGVTDAMKSLQDSDVILKNQLTCKETIINTFQNEIVKIIKSNNIVEEFDDLIKLKNHEDIDKTLSLIGNFISNLLAIVSKMSSQNNIDPTIQHEIETHTVESQTEHIYEIFDNMKEIDGSNKITYIELEKSYEEKCSHYTQLEQTHANCETEIETLKTALNDAKLKADKLNRQLETAERQLESFKQQLDRIQDKDHFPLTSDGQKGSQLCTQLEALNNQNTILEKEKSEVRHECKLLIELSAELQKQIIWHRMNLSTLVATTFAEKKLLQTEYKTLQMDHNRLHKVCHKEFLGMFEPLQQLYNLLLSDTVIEREDDFRVNANSTLVSDINQPFISANSSFNNMTSKFANESTLPSDALMLDNDMTLENDTNISNRTVKASSIEKLSCLISSSIPLEHKNLDAESQTTLNVGKTEDNIKSYVAEIEKLKEEIKRLKGDKIRLQDDYDTLSTEMMDNITELDSLKKKFEDIESGVCSKCTENEKVIENLQSQVNDTNFAMISNDKLSKSEEALYEEWQEIRSNESVNQMKKRCSTIESIHNELAASMEDVKKINCEVNGLGELTQTESLIIQKELQGEFTGEELYQNIETNNCANANNDDVHLKTIEHLSERLKESMEDLNNFISKTDCEKTQLVEFIKQTIGSDVDIPLDSTNLDLLQHFYNLILVKHGNALENLRNELKMSEDNIDLLKMKLTDVESEINILNQENLASKSRSNEFAKWTEKMQLFCDEMFGKQFATEDNEVIIDRVLNKYKTEMNRLNELLTEVKRELESKNIEIERIKEDNVKVEESNKLLRKTLDEYDERMITLKSDLSNIEENQRELLKEKENQIKCLENKLEESNNTRANLIVLNEDLMNKLNICNEQIQHFENSMVEATAQIKRKHDEILEMKEKAENMVEKTNSRETEQLKQNLTNVIEENKQLSHSKEKLADLYSKLELEYKAALEQDAEQISNLKTCIDNEKERVSIVESEKSKLEESISSLRNKYDDICSEHKNCEEKFTQSKDMWHGERLQLEESLKIQERIYQESLLSYQEKIKEKEKLINSLESTHITTLQTLEEYYENIINENKASINGYTENLAVLQNNFSTLTSQISDLKAVNSLFEEEKKSNEALLEKSEIKLLESKQVVDSLKERLRHLEESVTHLEKKCTERDVKISYLESSKRANSEGIEHELQKTKECLEQKTNECVLLEKHNKNHQKTAEYLNSMLKRLKAEKIDAEGKVKQLEVDYSGKCKELENALAELVCLRKSCEDKSSEINNLKVLNEMLEDRVPLELNRETDSPRISGRRSLRGEARKERRSSVHDAIRATDNAGFDISQLPHEDLANETQLRETLRVLKKNYSELEQRYKELDEECEICGQVLIERDQQISRLRKERDALQAKMDKHTKTILARSVTYNTSIGAQSLINTNIKSDPDAAREQPSNGLESLREEVNMLKMEKSMMMETSQMAEQEFELMARGKNSIEAMFSSMNCNKDSRRLSGTFRAKRQSIHDMSRKSNEHDECNINMLPKEEYENEADLREALRILKENYADLEQRYKEIDEECEMCGEALREKEEQNSRLKKERDALQVKLDKHSKNILNQSVLSNPLISYKSKPKMHEASTNTTSPLKVGVVDLFTYEREKDRSHKLQTLVEDLKAKISNLNAELRRVQYSNNSVDTTVALLTTKPMTDSEKLVENLRKEIDILKTRMHEASSQDVESIQPANTGPSPFATSGSGIVESAKISDLALENHKLKHANAKLLKFYKKYKNVVADENKPPRPS